MKITVLGTSSGLTVLHRHASAVLVESAGTTLLLDAGEGVTRQLLRFGIDPNVIEAVFISHTHPDHVTGLFHLMVHMHLIGRESPLAIRVPQGVRKQIQDLFPVFQIYRDKWSFPFKVESIAPGPVYQNPPLSLLALPNTHLSGNDRLAEAHGIGTDSYSFLMAEDEKRTIYTSDVSSLDHLRSSDKAADLLLVECTHIGIDEIVDFAVEGRIPRVLLTHIPPEIENASLPEIADGSIAFAEEGTVIEV